jgi:arginine decarboxylase
MVHFFMNFGIKDDNEYYEWLKQHVEKYCDIKKICPRLEMLNIWWGLPIRFWFKENHDYEKIIYNIVKNIKEVCDKNNVSHPNIFSEFWSYTVWESAVNIYEVLREKVQKSGETWYMIDSSFMTTIPDSWWLHQSFPVIPLNNLCHETKNVRLGWITCDKDDYLTNKNSNDFNMPIINKNKPLYFMVMHTWAYQENISGYGIWWLSHCQLDWEKILVLKENWEIEVFFDWNDTKERLKTLGYK